MKILVLSLGYPQKNAPHNGIFVHQQVKALQTLGVECHVFQPVVWYPPLGLHRFHTYWKKGFDEHQNLFPEFEGVKIHHPKMFVKMPSRFFPESYDIRMSNSIVNYISNNKELKNFDLIWSHFLYPEGRVAVNLKKALKLPLVSMALGDDVHAWPEENLTIRRDIKVVLNEADRLVANSKRLGNDTTKWMDDNSIREVDVIYNGVDYHLFRPLRDEEEKKKIYTKFQLPSTKKYMICVARPVVLKGWLELFDSIKTLSMELEDWELLIVAPPPWYKDEIDLTLEAKNRGIEKKIKMIGKLDPANLSELMRICEIFVMPSYNEGMSNAVLEAMATGLTVITTEVGGHAEIIKTGYNGFLIEPKSLEPILQNIKFVISNESLRVMIGKNARESMINFGDYTSNCKKLLNLFQTTLNSSEQ